MENEISSIKNNLETMVALSEKENSANLTATIPLGDVRII